MGPGRIQVKPFDLPSSPDTGTPKLHALVGLSVHDPVSEMPLGQIWFMQEDKSETTSLERIALLITLSRGVLNFEDSIVEGRTRTFTWIPINGQIWSGEIPCESERVRVTVE